MKTIVFIFDMKPCLYSHLLATNPDIVQVKVALSAHMSTGQISLADETLGKIEFYLGISSVIVKMYVTSINDADTLLRKYGYAILPYPASKLGIKSLTDTKTWYVRNYKGAYFDDLCLGTDECFEDTPELHRSIKSMIATIGMSTRKPMAVQIPSPLELNATMPTLSPLLKRGLRVIDPNAETTLHHIDCLLQAHECIVKYNRLIIDALG
jgi:hypothetical protein